MAYTPSEQQRLMDLLAQRYRLQLAELQSYTVVQLRELWRVLETARSDKQWAAAARNGFGAISAAQQANATVLAGGLLAASGEVYKQSGTARKSFKPTSGDTASFLREVAPVLTQAAERELGYHLSRAVRGEISRTQAMNTMAGISQLAAANTTREFITRESLRSKDVPVDVEPVEVKERYAPASGSRSVEEHFAIDDSSREIRGAVKETENELTSWLDEDEFKPHKHEEDGTWLDEFDSADEVEEEFVGWDEDPYSAVDQDLIAEWKKEQATPSAVHTDVRSGGCMYCKIVGIGKGPHKWHTNCNCINLPAWKDFEYGAPPWEGDALNKYYTARAVAETYTDTKNGYITMDDIMREIRIMESMEQNKIRIARGEKPRKIHDRKGPKSFDEKMRIRARNAARLQRMQDLGQW